MDWKSLISRLQARGLSQTEIAFRCKCGQSTISDLATGATKDPRHSVGEALNRLEREADTVAAPPSARPTELALVDRRDPARPNMHIGPERRAPTGEGAA